MSLKLINHSQDLKRLRDEGYELEIRGGFLLVKGVPYMNSKKEVKVGTLVSTLTLAGDITAKPDNHVAYFEGEYPCHKDGKEIERIKNESQKRQLATDVNIDHTFSARPSSPYTDYYHKVTTYVDILSGPARAISPNVTAKTFPVIETSAEDEEAVFNYIDTASSRAEIDLISKKLTLEKIAIVGLGGTGSYVLDLVAKTPVKEIHLFDGDTFLQHNAFRSPGAPSVEDLKAKPNKTSYLKGIYAKMRKGIVSHDASLGMENITLLQDMNFVFLALDGGEAKKLIVEKLKDFGVRFIDVGMGVYESEGALAGILRITTCTPEKSEHIYSRTPFSEGNAKNEYAANIQIADLNALNAALAVIKWKKMCGFYHDLENEHHSLYTIDGNTLANEEKPR